VNCCCCTFIDAVTSSGNKPLNRKKKKNDDDNDDADYSGYELTSTKQASPGHRYKSCIKLIP